MRTIADIALTRLGLLEVTGAPSHARARQHTLTQLARLGYTLANPELLNDSVMATLSSQLQLLKQERGGGVPYVPLFSAFPGWSEGAQALTRWLAGGGELLRRPLFGAHPVTGLQSRARSEAGEQDQADRQPDDRTSWRQLRLARSADFAAQLRDYLRQQLGGATAVAEALRPDLELLLDTCTADALSPSGVPVRENRVFLMLYFWRRQLDAPLARWCTTATDWLRLLAGLAGSDVALNGSTRFPALRRADRRRVLHGLEQLPGLERDLPRFRGLWLAVARSLHAREWQNRFPRAVAALQALRDHRLHPPGRELELALRDRQVDACLEQVAAEPGVFARRLHQLLARFPGYEPQVLGAFGRVADRVPARILVVLEAHLRSYAAHRARSLINKRGRVRVLPPAAPLPPHITEKTLALVRAALSRALADRQPSWQGRRVWIDPRLASYTLPLQLRKASEGGSPWGRGSRVPLPEGRVVRLFLWWKQAQEVTDLDLSVLLLSEDFEQVGHVSYTRLSSEGITHSGDVRSAPFGAAELIDLDLAVLARNPACRYVAALVFRYIGDAFADMECQAGWMVRNQVGSSAVSFDPKTVEQRFVLGGPGSYALPAMIDLQRREAVFLDLYLNGAPQHNRVEGAASALAQVLAQADTWLQTRPRLDVLAEHHLRARGAVRANGPLDADITFGVDEGTYNLRQPQRALADLL